MTRLRFTPKLAALMFAAATSVAQAASKEQSCAAVKCASGTQVVTYATKEDPFFACPTAQLSDYIGFVLGTLQMQVSLGYLPNISP